MKWTVTFSNIVIVLIAWDSQKFHSRHTCQHTKFLSTTHVSIEKKYTHTYTCFSW